MDGAGDVILPRCGKGNPLVVPRLEVFTWGMEITGSLGIGVTCPIFAQAQSVDASSICGINDPHRLTGSDGHTLIHKGPLAQRDRAPDWRASGARRARRESSARGGGCACIAAAGREDERSGQEQDSCKRTHTGANLSRKIAT